MNDQHTSEWTMSDRPKKSVGATLKDIEIEQGGLQVRIEKLERWRDGYTTDDGANIDGVNDRLKTNDFKWRILWVSVGIIGTIAMAVFGWLLSKI